MKTRIPSGTIGLGIALALTGGGLLLRSFDGRTGAPAAAPAVTIPSTATAQPAAPTRPAELKPTTVRAVDALPGSAQGVSTSVSDLKNILQTIDRLVEPATDRTLSVRVADPRATDFAGLADDSAREHFLESDALNVLASVAPDFGIVEARAEYVWFDTFKDELGFTHVRMQQVAGGLEVVGGQLVVHYDRQGRAYEVNGRHVARARGVERTPWLDTDKARQIARADLRERTGREDVEERIAPRLVIYGLEGAAALAYETSLRYESDGDLPGRWRYWVHAHKGTVLATFNEVHTLEDPILPGQVTSCMGSRLADEGGQVVTLAGWRCLTNGIYYLYNPTNRWQILNAAYSGYPDSQGEARRSAPDWGTSDRAEISCAHGLHLTQHYYRSHLGRASYNRSNALAGAWVHYGSNLANAFWDSDTQTMFFGDGNGSSHTSLAVLDIIGHEYTHAVTEHSAGLIYRNESGALNESFSDILGVAIEFAHQPDGRAAYPNCVPGQADWLQGEDCVAGTSGAFRDFRNPRRFSQPSRYRGTAWYTGSDDHGGVHYNSGVQNHMFYLLCEGGRGTNDGLPYAVTGIGVSNAARVAYRALTAYCVPATDYAGARAAWLSAARDLQTNWVVAVSAAWAAVMGVTSNEVDAWDPADDTAAGATLIAPALVEQAHGPHILRSTDLYDWYRMPMTAGVAYVLHSRGGTGDTYAELYASAAGGTPVATDDDSAGSLQFQISYTARVSAVHYLRVHHYNLGGTANYHLSHRAGASSAPTGDAWDPADDTASGGTWLAPHPTLQTNGPHRLASTDCADWYRVLLTPGVSYLFTTRGGTGDVEGELFADAAASRRVAYDDDSAGGGQFRLVYAPTNAGTFFLRVRTYGACGTAAYSLTFRRTAPEVAGPTDLNLDGLGEVALFHPSSACWDVLDRASGRVTGFYLGTQDSVPLLADFDADGQPDSACYTPRTGYWYIRGSRDQRTSLVQWGFSGAVPVPADYDGDARADVAVYVPASGLWYIRRSASANALEVVQWGHGRAVPVLGDYDGDRLADIAVYDLDRGQWFIRHSRDRALDLRSLGWAGAAPVPSDYDGDGRTDIAVYHRAAGNWHIESSAGGGRTVRNFGWQETVAVPADYDNDGRTDLAVLHPATRQWYVRGSDGDRISTFVFGSDTRPGATQYQLNRMFGLTP